MGLGLPGWHAGDWQPWVSFESEAEVISFWPPNLPFRLWTFPECACVLCFLLYIPASPALSHFPSVIITLISPPVLSVWGLASSPSSFIFKRKKKDMSDLF